MLLAEALERETATSEVLKIIASSPGNLQAVFEAIVNSGRKLFSGAAVSIALPDGGMVKAAAVAESDPLRAQAWLRRFPFPLTREYMHSIAILDAKIVDIPEVQNAPSEFAAGSRNFLASGYRAITIMPLLCGDVAIGVLSVVRQEPGPLSDKQLTLLHNFAAQAVIAIENTRLLNELRQRTDDLSESLEQQTATSEVLGVISSSPGDLAPVFQAMLRNSMRICEAKFGQMFLAENDTARMVAHLGIPDELARSDLGRGSFHPTPGGPLAQVMRTRALVHVPDLACLYPEYPPVKLGERAPSPRCQCFETASWWVRSPSTAWKSDRFRGSRSRCLPISPRRP